MATADTIPESTPTAAHSERSILNTGKLGHFDVTDAKENPVELPESIEDVIEEQDEMLRAVSQLLQRGCFVSLYNPVHYSFSPEQARAIAAPSWWRMVFR